MLAPASCILFSIRFFLPLSYFAPETTGGCRGGEGAEAATAACMWRKALVA